MSYSKQPSSADKDLTIEFRNVGRGKRTWRVDLPAQPAAHLPSRILRAIEKSGALGSRGIDIEYDTDTWDGTILVGGFREVGTFALVSSADHNQPKEQKP